jgi:hypothetical protein
MRSAALQERLESRRGWEAGEAAAASQHAALLAAAARSWRLQFDSDWPGRELAAALAAIGPPDSAPMLAALGYGDQGALRFVCEPERRLEAVALLVVAYGESPDACAGMLRLLEDDVHAIFRAACRGSGGAPAAGALLGAYRRAGRLHEALAADDHAALRGAASIGADSCVVPALLAEYGEPGGAPVLAALGSRAHEALRAACTGGSKQKTTALLAAYGHPGCAAVRAPLAAEDADRGCLLRRAAEASLQPLASSHDAVLAALVAALGAPRHAPAGSAPSHSCNQLQTQHRLRHASARPLLHTRARRSLLHRVRRQEGQAHAAGARQRGAQDPVCRSVRVQPPARARAPAVARRERVAQRLRRPRWRRRRRAAAGTAAAAAVAARLVLLRRRRRRPQAQHLVQRRPHVLRQVAHHGVGVAHAGDGVGAEEDLTGAWGWRW